MTTRPFPRALLGGLILMTALPLAACGGGEDEVVADDGSSAGDAEGTISDAMLDTDLATDQAPLDPASEIKLPTLPGAEKVAGDQPADAEGDKPAAPKPAEPVKAPPAVPLPEREAQD